MHPRQALSSGIERVMSIRPERLARWVSCLAFAGTTLLAAESQADIEFYSKDDWTLSTDGRFNAFISYTNGSGIPLGKQVPVLDDMGNPVIDPATGQPQMEEGQPPNVAGAGLEESTDNDNNVENFRVRSGFVASILGFTGKKQISEDLSATGRIALWAVSENARASLATNRPDVRNVFFRLDGGFGGLLLGRDLALFSRGAIETNFMYGHANGLGAPCQVHDIGPTCGHVGFGVFFPAFNAGVVYNTPDLGGLKVTAGVYDPATYKQANFVRTPLPRLESEVTYDIGDDENSGFKIHAFVNGLWQRLVEAGNPRQPKQILTNNAWGVGAGVRAEVEAGSGWLKMGAAGHTGKGVGLTLPIEDTPNNAREFTDPVTDPATGMQVGERRRIELRKSNGMFFQAMYSIDPIDVMVGYGVSRMVELPEDVVDFNLIREQRGISTGLFYHFDPVVLGIDYFRADYEWHKGETQGVNTINLGGTLLW